MKKILLCSLIVLSLCTACYAACSHSGCNHSGCSHSHGGHSGHHSNHSSSSSSEHVYLVKQDYKKTEQKFPNCNKHYMEVETRTYYYSDGTVRAINNVTLYNSDGTVLVSDCTRINHILYNNSHYFIVCKNGCYLMDSEGNIKSIDFNSSEVNNLLVKASKAIEQKINLATLTLDSFKSNLDNFLHKKFININPNE